MNVLTVTNYLKVNDLLKWFDSVDVTTRDLTLVPYTVKFMRVYFGDKKEQTVHLSSSHEPWNVLQLAPNNDREDMSSLTQFTTLVQTLVKKHPERKHTVVALERHDQTRLVKSVYTFLRPGYQVNEFQVEAVNPMRYYSETHLNPFASPIAHNLKVDMTMPDLKSLVKKHWAYVTMHGIKSYTFLRTPLGSGKKIEMLFDENGQGDVFRDCAPFDKDCFDEKACIVDGVVLKLYTLCVQDEKTVNLLVHEPVGARLKAFKNGTLGIGPSSLTAMQLWHCAHTVHETDSLHRNYFVANYLLSDKAPISELKALWQTAVKHEATRVLAAILLHPHSKFSDYPIEQVCAFLTSLLGKQHGMLANSLLHRLLMCLVETNKLVQKQLKGLMKCYQAITKAKATSKTADVTNELNRVMIQHVIQSLSKTV